MGIYAVRIRLGSRLLKGVCYIGKRPSFHVSHDLTVEVHIFKFCRNLYGRDLEVFFIKRIRADKKFPSQKELIQRIKQDIRIARATL